MATLTTMLEVTKFENPTWNLDSKKFKAIMREYPIISFPENGKKSRVNNPEISSVYAVYERLNKKFKNLPEGKDKKELKNKIDTIYFDYRWLKMLKERLEFYCLMPNFHHYGR